MNLSKEDLTLIKQGLPELDKLGKYGRTHSDLLHKLEQELGDDKTSLRKQNLKPDSAFDKYAEYIRSKLDKRTLLEQLAEEACELSQSALKIIRADGMSDNYTPVSSATAWDNLSEEVLDVVIVLYLIFGVILPVSADADKKIKRWAERLGYMDEQTKE